jgi:hypothetical protein
MAVVLPTLDGKVDRSVQVALQRLADYITTLELQIQDLKAQLAALPPPLSLDQIQQALSAGGSHPLNLTGLIGAPAADTTPV